MKLKEFPDPEQFDILARTGNVIPVCREILADMETPVSLLTKCYPDGDGARPPIFLLESVEGGEKWGRYSFLGTSARTQIKVFADRLTIVGNGNTEVVDHDGDPLSVLRQFMGRFRPAEMNELPRFWGGLVGYLTYEMVSFFERIPNRLPADVPLAHFIVVDELLIFDNIRNTMICVAIAFTDDHADAGVAYADAVARLDAMEARIGTPIGGAPSRGEAGSLTIKPLLAADAFKAQVDTVKDHIFQGDVIQTVISQPFQCEAPTDIIALYRAQRYVNPSPYLYFFHFDEMALVGSSPETMVRLENRVATLRPIAGTRPRGSSEQSDRALASELLADEKERAEHLMLVDLGRNDLGRVARTGTVQVTDLMVVERYSHVMHLVSNINCDVEDDYDAWDLLRAAFPAGTLSGAPKVRAMEIIDELEQGPRGPYGGAVGYVSFNGNMDLAITIRTACIVEGTLTVRAGAGIVADSDPETERMETVNKAMAIQRALELTRRGRTTTP